jgi:hypothetical protein
MPWCACTLRTRTPRARWFPRFSERQARLKSRQVKIDAAVDRASGVEVFHTMLVMRTGKEWALPAANAQDAQTKATAIRAFLGVTA